MTRRIKTIEITTMKRSTYGVALVILGIIMFSYTEINFITTKKVVDIGPFKISKEENHLVQWPRVISVVLVLGGIALTVRGRRRPA